MDIFTSISLMIGIFGATLAAIVSIKTFGDHTVKDAVANAGVRTKHLAEIARGKTAIRICRACRKGTTCCSWGWGSLLVVPIACFAVWIFSLAFYVGYSDSCSHAFSTKPVPNQAQKDPNAVSDANARESLSSHDRDTIDPADVTWSLRRGTLRVVTIINLGCTVAGLALLSIVWLLSKLLNWQYSTAVEEGSSKKPSSPYS